MRLFTKKKRWGLALGSGGAKGMAHLGALQAFADANMQFDMVAGTSAGAIVGAMYCKGYSPTDISELLARLEYGGVALSVLRTGSLLPLVELLDDLLGGCDIADLPDSLHRRHPFSVYGHRLAGFEAYPDMFRLCPGDFGRVCFFRKISVR